MPVEGDINVSEKRILDISDTHWRDSDIKTIGGYCEATNLVAQDLLKIMRDYKITHVIHNGDWCDKGYRTQHELHSHRNVLQEMNEITEDNVYMCLGNHFFLERDSNPELYWIQPNEVYKPVKSIYASKPLIKITPTLVLGCTQFSFFHYNKNQKTYIAPRVPGIKFHCGVYHDECVVPMHVRLDEGIRTQVLPSYTRSIFSNIDFGVIGHIHTPVGEVMAQVDGRNIPLDIPGSLAVMTTKVSDLHTSVRLPIFTVTETSLKKEYVPVSLHTERLKFFKKKDKPLDDKTFMCEDLKNVSTVEELLQKGMSNYISADSYLRMRGVSDRQIKMYEAASAGRLDVTAAVRIIVGKE